MQIITSNMQSPHVKTNMFDLTSRLDESGIILKVLKHLSLFTTVHLSIVIKSVEDNKLLLLVITAVTQLIRCLKIVLYLLNRRAVIFRSLQHSNTNWEKWPVIVAFSWLKKKGGGYYWKSPFVNFKPPRRHLYHIRVISSFKEEVVNGVCTGHVTN